ncbi:hypothetical protein J437_LFUL009792 [Ladona fulva]|uniref:Craniofacial development protein 2-like n=1 Tax=Ladona fulva TaxID=123851 RepID=A0A8K0P439_LADFU|nr:hypothetical protein J437_LFUL009792 [Ladona fulva]
MKDSGGKTYPHSDLRMGNIPGNSWRFNKKTKTTKVKTKDRTRKSTNNEIRIGTWNVRTLNRKEKLENLKREMERNKIDVLGLSEIRCEGEGEVILDGYMKQR